MKLLKFVLLLLVMAAMAGVVPQAHAQATVKVMIGGASGTWQNLATGTFKAGACPTGSSPGCAHYTNNHFNLTDTRPSLLVPPSANVTDTGTIWIVWDNTTADPACATKCNVWAYIKVDSIVGNRCYFAQPQCTVNVNPFPAPNGQITLPAPAWGADTLPPVPVQALFTTGIKVNVAASEVRPEDALFGQCRINSKLGGSNDGLNGLGLGINSSGVCPAFGAPVANLEGKDLVSAYPGSASTAHPMAFNISGTDPFTNTAIPAFSTAQIGAVPLIFITNRQGALAGVTNATVAQLQAAFSGANCLGSNFAGGAATNINVYSREPLSGTMNTAEYTTFRLPRNGVGSYAGASQETGLGGIEPVSGVACKLGGKRYQGIGAGEEVKFVQNSNTNFGVDGIGYAFFGYGTIAGLADNANYAYLTVDGVDPLWSVYGTHYDPGQNPNPGQLPGVADLPAACAGNFPCSETSIWFGHQSYPNVRSGAYRQWAMVRLIGNGVPFANAVALIASAQAASVNTVPDFIPAAASGTDKGLQLLRSHYRQSSVGPSTSHDVGGDEGGCIVAAGSTADHLVQREPACVVGP